MRMLLIGLLSLFQPATQLGESSSIVGSVRDNLGAVIGGAHVVMHADAVGRVTQPPDVTLRSDPSGRFQANASPGFYDVCVLADAFDPECRKVLVGRGSAARTDFQLRLNAAVAERIGERF